MLSELIFRDTISLSLGSKIVTLSTLFFIEPFKLGSILVFNSRTREAQHARKASDMRLGRPKGKGKSKLDEHSGEINRLVVLGVPQKHYC